jgi:hypothetical protein
VIKIFYKINVLGRVYMEAIEPAWLPALSGFAELISFCGELTHQNN